MRQVRDERHQAVVHVGLDRGRPCADGRDDRVETLVELGAGFRRRGEEVGGPREQVAACVAHPAALGAADRMPADESLTLAGVERAQHRHLGRSDVAHDAIVAGAGEHLTREVGDLADRSRHEHRTGIDHGIADRRGAPGDRAAFQPGGDRLRVGIEPSHLPHPGPRAQREPE